MINEVIDKKIASILKLKLNERIYAYQVIWQSILQDIQKESNILSKEQLMEIDKRLDRIEKGQAKMYSWDEIKQEIKSGL